MNKSALIITWEKYQDHELIYPYYSLKEHGFHVTLMANKEGKIYGSLGSHMTSNYSVDVLDDAETFFKFLEIYNLLVIPGGVKALEKLRQVTHVLRFVRAWNEKNKMIFSVCNGAQLLISADVLKGRTVTGYYAISTDIQNAGAVYSRDPVVVDGNIISCPHYDYMGEWMAVGYEALDTKKVKELHESK